MDPKIRARLSKKFKPRQRCLPKYVPKVRPIDGFRHLRTALLSLSPGTVPGSGGLRNEFLTALGERMEDEELRLLKDLGLAYSAAGFMLSGTPCKL